MLRFGNCQPQEVKPLKTVKTYRFGCWVLFHCDLGGDNSSLPFFSICRLERKAKKKRKEMVWGGQTGREDPAAEARRVWFLRLQPGAAGSVSQYLLLPLEVPNSAKACTCSQAASPAALGLKLLSKLQKYTMGRAVGPGWPAGGAAKLCSFLSTWVAKAGAWQPAQGLVAMPGQQGAGSTQREML